MIDVATKTILHIGCGRKQFASDALLRSVGLRLNDVDAYTVKHLDRDALLSPDIVCALGDDRIPVDDNSVDIVVAFHVLEHVSADARSWFYAFEELYRVLKPNGLLYGESPNYDSIWAWSDPTHVRAISEHSFAFFNQDAYRIDGSPISPYRIRCDFGFVGMPGMPKGFAVITGTDARDRNLRFALTARKPFVPWWEDAPA